MSSVQEFFENLKEAVATAERALLFTLGFEFNVKKPFEVLVGDPKTSTSVGRTGDPAGSEQARFFSVCLCNSQDVHLRQEDQSLASFA